MRVALAFRMAERAQRVVVALGGSAFTGAGSFEVEHQLASRLVHHLQPILLGGVEVVVTHGGGAQVSKALKGSATSYVLPQDVASTEGELGDALATALRDELNETRPVAALLTHVRVDPGSAGFRRPSRQVGPVLDEAHAAELRRANIPLAACGKGYRRLVPQVEPVEVLDVEIIKRLVESGVVVVAGGGGGIPVVREGKAWRTVEAAVDQDLTAALLADRIDADLLVVVTDVPHVFENHGTPHQKAISLIGADELRNLLAEGAFVPGTMAPKVEACVRFVARPGRRAVVCDPETLERALSGQAGTRVFYPAQLNAEWAANA
jgi:carbamate kinase